MSERMAYAPGTPNWVDLASPDPTAAADFYGALLGWTAKFDPRPEAGGYAMFTLRDKLVAGVGPQMNPDMPPFWSVYVSVADADSTVGMATDAGATLLAGPMDIFDAGRMAVLQDPVGSYISLWQPGETIGCELVNETGTFAWNELSTTDLAAATEFYTKVFGWGIDADSGGDQSVIFTVEGNIVCGAHVAGEGEFPAWSVWFTVDDCDASSEQVRSLGGSILNPPSDMGFGRGAVVADPHGAVFGIGAISEAVSAG